MGALMKPFARWFDGNVSWVQIVPKASSSFMARLSVLVGAARRLGFGTVSAEQFMSGYTTTIGRVIYSDEITMDSAPSALLIHELCHVLQFQSRAMALEYVCSPRRRAYYESEAMQAAWLCFPVEFSDEYVDRKVAHLRAYGVSDGVARTEIEARIDEVGRAAPQPRARRIALALEDWRRLAT
jgi:hypothetical protein